MSDLLQRSRDRIAASAHALPQHSKHATRTRELKLRSAGAPVFYIPLQDVIERDCPEGDRATLLQVTSAAVRCASAVTSILDAEESAALDSTLSPLGRFERVRPLIAREREEIHALESRLIDRAVTARISLEREQVLPPRDAVDLARVRWICDELGRLKPQELHAALADAKQTALEAGPSGVEILRALIVAPSLTQIRLIGGDVRRSLDTFRDAIDPERAWRIRWLSFAHEMATDARIAVGDWLDRKASGKNEAVTTPTASSARRSQRIADARG